MTAGHRTEEALTEPRKLDTGRPYKIPQLMAAQEGERTQLMRILVSRVIGGIDERTRGLTQRWFDMVDWRSAHVGSDRLGVSRSIEGYARKLEGEVNVQHPARIWVEQQENKFVVNEPERLPTTSECGHHLLQIVKGLKQGTGSAAEGVSWRTADPSRYPQQVCRGLAQLLSREQVNSEEAQWLAKQVGSRLPPGWGATWTERGCSELQGTPTDQRQLVVSYLGAMEVRCVECQVRYAGTCRQCHLRWCTLCQQNKEECDVCGVPLALTVDLGAGRANPPTQRLRAKGVRDAEVTSVNMHRLGESFVEKVSDVRRRVTVDGKAAAPGESLEFLAFIQGWQSEVRGKRLEQLLRLNDIGLRVALENATEKDIFFIPEVHFAGEKPTLADDDGWWYQVRSVIWCRACRKCRVRKDQEGFTCKELNKKQLATCTGCDGKKGVTRVSSKETNRVRNRVKHPPNPQARRPRAAQGKGGAVKDVTSGSEDVEMEGVEWGACMYGVRMTPAHPWIVGRGDDKCGGEVVYSIQDIRQLLSVQPEDVKRWLTTSQMGWSLTREENEVVNEKDEREGKPVTRQLAPMISKFIRAQWE